jgi:macrodomain Ter protein organizer (MatP/YcbG family)
MDTKLTIRLDQGVIERAKDYAKDHKTSLSKMVEAYLDSITRSEEEQDKITPIVESLSGVIELKDDSDFKKDYSDFLNEKYK